MQDDTPDPGGQALEAPDFLVMASSQLAAAETEAVYGDLDAAMSQREYDRSAAPDYARPRLSRRAEDLQPRLVPWRKKYTAALVVADTGWAALVGASFSSGEDRVLAVCALVGGLLGSLILGRVYEHRFQGHGTDELRRALVAGVGLLAVASTLSVAFPNPSYRRAVVFGVPAAVLGSALLHVAARGLLGRLRRRGRCVQRVVAVGLERSVAELIRSARSEPWRGFDVVGACVEQVRGSDIEGVPVAGSPQDVPQAMVRSGADTVVLTAWSDVSPEDLRRLSWDIEGSGVELLVASRLAGVTAPRIHLRTVGGTPLLRVESPEFKGVLRVAKTLFDYSLASFLLLMATPALVAIGAAVRWTSPGPVFFRQVRVGRHGETFVMHKFRSMYLDAEARLENLQHLNEHDKGPLFKMKDDPRVTRVGKFIRRYSLDELPQLIDVILGRMSLVGPRPPLPSEVEKYGNDVRRRLRVKPGLTGLWQVSGRSDLTWEQSVRLDLHYVENWSLALDLSILARTARAVVGRDGAY